MEQHPAEISAHEGRRRDAHLHCALEDFHVSWRALLLLMRAVRALTQFKRERRLRAEVPRFLQVAEDAILDAGVGKDGDGEG
jgi:hypothetical protein